MTDEDILRYMRALESQWRPTAYLMRGKYPDVETLTDEQLEAVHKQMEARGRAMLGSSGRGRMPERTASTAAPGARSKYAWLGKRVSIPDEWRQGVLCGSWWEG